MKTEMPLFVADAGSFEDALHEAIQRANAIADAWAGDRAGNVVTLEFRGVRLEVSGDVTPKVEYQFALCWAK